MTTKQYNDSIKLHADGIYRYAIKLCGNPIQAQDLVQSIFEKAWVKKETIDFEKCKSLFFRMTHNLFIDQYRKQQKRNTYLTVIHSEHRSTDYASSFEAKDLVDKAFEALNDSQKTLIVLRDLEGYNYIEIGEIMGFSLSQVKIKLFRARKALKSELEKLDSSYSSSKAQIHGC